VAPASPGIQTSAGAQVPSGAQPSSTVAPPAPAPKEAFGLYAVEHPVAPKSATDSITAKVVGLGLGANGRQTVSLEGGPLWELDGSDALLADGDSVTIKRAALGSYLLTTPAGRTHRVRRLR
jgi:hypothetical protein